MKQISNKKNSLSYVYYWMLGYILALEPFFLVRLFNTYLPNFYYRWLTLPISIVLGIVAFQKMRAVFPLPNISQVYRAICQVPKILLKPKFWKNVLKSSKIISRDLINSFRKSNSKEPMVQIHQEEAFKATRLAIISSILAFTSLCYLFVTNLSDFGLFETSLKILGYLFLYFIFVLLCIKLVSISTIKQNNGKNSEQDLVELLCLLRSELEDWDFDDRILLELEGKKGRGDIDIMAISPEGNYFIIELKSHKGIVRWNSTLEELCHKLKQDTEFSPFKEDFFAQVKGQGKRLQDFRELSRFPDLIIVFWRAEVKIDPKKNLIKKVKIVDRSRLIRELKKRNNRLVKEMVSE